MLEPELFGFLEQTANAAWTVTESGEICSWNRAAEQLFDYPAGDVLGRNVDDVLEARDALNTEAFAGGAEAAVRHWDGAAAGIPNFDLEVRTRARGRIWVNVSTIIFDNRRTGRRLFVRLAHEITQSRRNAALVERMLDAARQFVALAGDETEYAPTKALSEQERRILKLFATGTNSATIVRKLEISTQTLRNHLHHINRKLRTHNRLEAVTHAQQRGLLD